MYDIELREKNGWTAEILNFVRVHLNPNLRESGQLQQ